MPKLTPWFSKHTKPVRIGTYLASIIPDEAPAYAPLLYWDGERWLWPDTLTPALNQQRYWCGLANPPMSATPPAVE